MQPKIARHIPASRTPRPSLKRGVRPGIVRPERRPSTQLAEAVGLYHHALPLMTNHRGRPYAKDSIDKHVRITRQFADHAGAIALVDVTAADALAYYAWLRGRGAKPQTVQTRDKVLRLFFDWCLSRKMLAEHPMDAQPRITAADPPVVAVTDAELRRVLAGCRDDLWTGLRDRALVLTFWCTGIRCGEAARLELGHYDEKRGFLRVPGTKTDNAPRTVGVPDELAYALEDWIVRARGREPGPLFPSEQRNAAMDRTVVGHLLARVGRRAGVPGLSQQRMRHTFSIRFLKESGGDIYTLSRILGHSTIVMSARYLRSLQQEDVAERHIQVMRRGGR